MLSQRITYDDVHKRGAPTVVLSNYIASIGFAPVRVGVFWDVYRSVYHIRKTCLEHADTVFEDRFVWCPGHRAYTDTLEGVVAKLELWNTSLPGVYREPDYGTVLIDTLVASEGTYVALMDKPPRVESVLAYKRKAAVKFLKHHNYSNQHKWLADEVIDFIDNECQEPDWITSDIGLGMTDYEWECLLDHLEEITEDEA